MTNAASPSAPSAAAPSSLPLGDRDYYPEIYRRIRRRVYCHEDAEDIAQETFLRAWQYRDSFDGRCSVRTWLWHIADNRVASFFEHNRYEREGRVWMTGDDMRQRDLDEVCPSAAPNAQRLIENAERLAAAWGAALTTRERKAMVLHCEGSTARQIAFRLQGTEGAIRVDLCRARAKMRAAA